MKRNPLISAILLIAGTCIGAAMLALPVVNHAQGFVWSLPSLVGCWLLTTLAGLVMLEVNLWQKPGGSLVSMATDTLGRIGQIAVWIMYGALLYVLMVALLSGLYDTLNHWVVALWHWHVPVFLGMGGLLILFGLMVYAGPRWIDHMNRLCMLGLLLCFMGLAVLLAPHVAVEKWTQGSMQGAWHALPVIVTAFGYQIVIPSLRTYLGNDVRRLRLAVLLGSLLPLLAYIVWQMLIMGVLTPHDLSIIAKGGQPATGITHQLSVHVQGAYLRMIARGFGFFALLTTFMGVSLSLYDFLADGFQIKQCPWRRLWAIGATFIPPGLMAMSFPNRFIAILAYASVFVVGLLILMPCLMAYCGRYRKRQAHRTVLYRLMGGRFLLIGMMLVSVGLITLVRRV